MGKKKNNRKQKRRNIVAQTMIERTGNHAGPHQNREYDLQRGSSRKTKHKKAPEDSGAYYHLHQIGQFYSTREISPEDIDRMLGRRP